MRKTLIYPKARKPKPEEITLEVLEDCRKTMARIVLRYGDVYLPIFERLHEEVEKKKHQEKIKELALKIVNDAG